MTACNPFPINHPIVVLIGPTAIGKTSLSIELAQEFDFEIISVDSMQVYRYMDIGTAKITKSEMKGIPHHLINVVNPDESFNAGLFEKMAIEAILETIARGKNILLTGGTGLYLSALINGLVENIPVFPEIRKKIENQLASVGSKALHKKLYLNDRISAERIHVNDSQRLVRALEIFEGTGQKWSGLIEEHRHKRTLRFSDILIIGLRCEREQLYRRIEKRSKLMIKSGLYEEVESLLKMGYTPELKSMRSIGYSHMVKLIQDEWDKKEFFEYLTRDTRRYAKRQFTWFNKIDGIQWLDTNDYNSIPEKITGFIKS